MRLVNNTGLQEAKTLVEVDNTPQCLAGTCQIGQRVVEQGSQERDMGDRLHLALGGHHIPGNHEMEACFCALPGQRCNDFLLENSVPPLSDYLFRTALLH